MQYDQSISSLNISRYLGTTPLRRWHHGLISSITAPKLPPHFAARQSHHHCMSHDQITSKHEPRYWKLYGMPFVKLLPQLITPYSAQPLQPCLPKTSQTCRTVYYAQALNPLRSFPAGRLHEQPNSATLAQRVMKHEREIDRKKNEHEPETGPPFFSKTSIKEEPPIPTYFLRSRKRKQERTGNQSPR